MFEEYQRQDESEAEGDTMSRGEAYEIIQRHIHPHLKNSKERKSFWDYVFYPAKKIREGWDKVESELAHLTGMF